MRDKNEEKNNPPTHSIGQRLKMPLKNKTIEGTNSPLAKERKV